MPMPILTEAYDPEILKLLRNITHDQYASMRSQSNDVSNKGEKTDLQREVKAIRKIAREALKNNNQRVIKYKYGIGRQTGRVYADNASLQNVPRFIRGALCHKHNIDIDAENCHPRLLESICQHSNIDCSMLSSYNQRRDEKLKKFCEEDDIDRSKAKQLFLISINNELRTTKLGKKNIRNEFYLSFDKEMKSIQSQLISKFPDLYQDIQIKHPNNHAGKMMAWILNEEEGKMLHRAVKHLEPTYNINCLAFDGLMVDTLMKNNEPSDPSKIIQDLNQLTQDINVTWASKRHDLSMMEEIRNLSHEEEDNLVVYGLNEMDIVNQIFKLRLQGRYYRWNNTKYLRTEHIWLTNDNDVKQVIARIVSNTDGLRERTDPHGNTTYENITQSLTGSEKIQNKLFNMAERDASFIENLEKRSEGKITFDNGYINFNLTRPTFVPFTSDNKDYDTINSIDRDFTYYSPHDPVRITLLNKIFKPMFCVEQETGDEWDTMEHYLHCLARAIAGEKNDKIFTMITGERDSCKSVFGDLMTNAFGRYVQIFSAATFRMMRDDSDEPKRLGTFLRYRHARVLVSQEIGENWLDGVLIKKFCSGGDPINARMLYCDEESFVPQFKLYFFGNEDPRVKPYDCMKKCWKYQMRCKFVEKMPERMLSNIKYYYADNKIKNYVREDDVMNAFVSMLMDYYQRTDTFKPIDEEEEEESLDPLTRLYEIFEITKDDNDRISNQELTSMYESEKDYFDSKKHLFKLLRNVGCKIHKIRGVRYYKGLKRIIDDEEEDCHDI